MVQEVTTEIKVKRSKRKKQTNMVKYIIKRIAIMFPMLILALSITFVLAQMMVVNPILFKVGHDDPQLLQRELERLGYYDPWYVKLFRYFVDFFTGNWGESYIVAEGKTVIQFIGEIFPKTLELMIVPIILTQLSLLKWARPPQDTKIK